MITTHADGGFTVEGRESIALYRLVATKTVLKAYLKTGMLMSRGATPKLLRSIVTEVTGKTYRASRAGNETALADLTALLDELAAGATR